MAAFPWYELYVLQDAKCQVVMLQATNSSLELYYIINMFNTKCHYTTTVHKTK